MLDERVATDETYDFRFKALAPALAVGPVLEFCADSLHVRDVMPEPFDITSHAGNMGFGGLIAASGAALFAFRHSEDSELTNISEENVSRFRHRGVALIMGTTALVNCATETRWGVRHLPVAEWLEGVTPDALDTLYSTVWSGIVALAFWKKTAYKQP